jgi:NADH-quinone oxidoreductase subunit N
VNPASFLTPVLHDTLQVSLPLFRTELALAVTVVLVLLVRMLPGLRRLDSGVVALGGILFAAWYAWSDLRGLPGSPWMPDAVGPERVELFTGLLVFDPLTAFLRFLLTGFLVLFAVFTRITGIPDREDSADFNVLVLGATLGMCLMASANHLLAVFMAVEMASVPSYALAGLLKGRRTSSEAALKYAVYGAGAAGVMLYGISLLAGSLGTFHLPTAAARLAEMGIVGFPEGAALVLALGGLMVGVGLAFKLSAVPFHFWAPDVFEGASAEVGGFLSVASKAAAVALLVRVALGLSSPVALEADMVPAASVVLHHADEAAAETAEAGSSAIQASASQRRVAAQFASLKQDGDGQEGDASNSEKPATEAAATETVAGATSAAVMSVDEQRIGLALPRYFIVALIAFMAAVTCTLGNLGAYGQTNIKRLLAYSTIAHAGYLMMGVAAAVALAGSNPSMAASAVAAVAFYLATYVFMNVSAFLIVAVLRNRLRSEEIASYAGLVKTSPGLVVLMGVVLVSLIGLPPLAGFVGKFLIFASLVEASSLPAEGSILSALLIVGGVNTVLSLFYYLRVLKVMTFDPPPSDRPQQSVGLVSLSGAAITAFVVPIVIFGVFWSGLYTLAHLAGGIVS